MIAFKVRKVHLGLRSHMKMQNELPVVSVNHFLYECRFTLSVETNLLKKHALGMFLLGYQ